MEYTHKSRRNANKLDRETIQNINLNGDKGNETSNTTTTLAREQHRQQKYHSVSPQVQNKNSRS